MTIEDFIVSTFCFRRSDITWFLTTASVIGRKIFSRVTVLDTIPRNHTGLGGVCTSTFDANRPDRTGVARMVIPVTIKALLYAFIDVRNHIHPGFGLMPKNSQLASERYCCTIRYCVISLVMIFTNSPVAFFLSSSPANSFRLSI